jgi:hypothetical protein
MAAKKKRTAREVVNERLFSREALRGAIARDNIEETLKHTKELLKRAAKKHGWRS